MWADIVGYIGGAILAGCILPQLARLWRTQSSQDISWAFNVLYLIGLALTLVYLHAKEALATFICALATFICVALQIAGGLFMLGMKVWLEQGGKGGVGGGAEA
ncbi:MAG: hypothetical protein J3K34DRAFT_517258 [Monoraphidium minutum]|nr:MAG: hypothetical protein J3K34DRAFT_517258 [Monoraphidium minutum]